MCGEGRPLEEVAPELRLGGGERGSQANVWGRTLQARDQKVQAGDELGLLKQQLPCLAGERKGKSNISNLP